MALRLKRPSCLIVAVCVAVCTAVVAFPQEVAYRVEGGRFIQRLTWAADPNVLRYEVVIESEDAAGADAGAVADTDAGLDADAAAGAGTGQQRFPVTNPYVEFSLAPGRYRATIEVYNLLDIIDYQMEPLAFEVLEALQPSVTRYSPGRLNNTAAQVAMTLNGRNLIEGTRVFLSRDGGQTRIEPLSFAPVDGGERAEVFFPPDNLSMGRWTLYVENPGGLTTTVSGVAVGDGTINLDISGVYSPVVPLRGGGDGSFPGSYLFDRAFTGGALYQGAGLKIAWAPLRLDTMSLGASFEPLWANLSSDLIADDIHYETLNAQLVGASASFLFRKSFFENMLSVNLSLGGGALALLNVNFKQSGESVPVTPFPFMTLGASVKYSPLRHLFIELGASLNLSVPFNPPDLFYLRPYAGAGYSF